MSESLLQKAKKKAASLGLDPANLHLSTKKDKKLLYAHNGRHIHFGAANSITWLEGASKQKRDSYRARASKITNKKGEYTHKIPLTSNYLAFNILW